MISNAHLDPIWQWQWEEGAVEALSTFRAAVKLLDMFPEYVFVHNESLLYEWVEELEPTLFKRISSLIRDGRWIVVGGWYVQPDCNIPGGESFVRQILVGKRYFIEKFGVEPTAGYNVDSFGHNGGLPQILSKSGYKYYLHFRPQPNELELPNELYLWLGVDGSEIIACRPELGHYVTDAGKGIDKAVEGIDLVRKNRRGAMAFWGVGDHGGGASAEELEELRKVIDSCEDVEIRHSDPEAYFDSIAELRDSLPVVKGDIQRCFTGCYTSAARIKRAHRQAEGLIAQAERFATLAAHTAGIPYPAEELDAAWKGLLFNQFHDILAGSSSEAGTQDGIDIFGHCTTIARKVRLKSALALAALDPPTEDGIPVYVFNPHAQAYIGPVEADLMIDYRPTWKGEVHVEVRDASGNLVPYQEETPTSRLPFEWRKKITFVAGVPPLSCARYMVHTNTAPNSAESAAMVTNTSNSFVVQTGRLRAIFDRTSGQLWRLMDLHEGRELLRDTGIGLLVIDDTGDSWGTGVDSYREVVGRFTRADAETLARLSGQNGADPLVSAIRVIEDGPVRTVVESVLKYGSSTAITQYSFYPNTSHVDIKVRVNWCEPRRMLKLAIPTTLAGAAARCEIPYGAIARETDGTEWPGQRWTVMELKDYLVGLVNTGQYGFDAKNAELRLSLLRSPVFCHNYGLELEADRTHTFMDLGEHEIRLALAFGRRDAAMERVIELTNRMNMPPFVMPYFPNGPEDAYNPANLSAESFISIAPANVILGALKVAEDGNGYIVRIHESAGLRTCAMLFSALAGDCEIELGPYELKSFRISKSGMETVDLMERSMPHIR